MFIFSEEKRKQLQEERPELSESELTRLLARMWNDLSEKKKVGAIPVFSSIPSLLLLWASRAVQRLLLSLPCTKGHKCPLKHHSDLSHSWQCQH